MGDRERPLDGLDVTAARAESSDRLAAFTALAGALLDDGVRFVLTGVWGTNFHALDAWTIFTTPAHDLFPRHHTTC